MCSRRTDAHSSTEWSDVGVPFSRVLKVEFRRAKYSYLHHTRDQRVGNACNDRWRFVA